MGFTPLEGLVMGTRSGDIDPAVLDYIATKEGLSLPQVEALLNSQSGLLGVSGLTNDMRDLLAEAREHDDRRAKLAIRMFCWRARKYVGAYLAAMGGADAIVFAGGIGENAPEIRAEICDGLQWAGLSVHDAANEALVGGAEGRFSTDDSRAGRVGGAHRRGVADRPRYLPRGGRGLTSAAELPRILGVPQHDN
jgi:acetate kinase